jgi:penicillin-binding protein 1A
VNLRSTGPCLHLNLLLNGGGRATSDTPPELVSAEDEARTARLGVWRRWR